MKAMLASFAVVAAAMQAGPGCIGNQPACDQTLCTQQPWCTGQPGGRGHGGCPNQEVCPAQAGDNGKTVNQETADMLRAVLVDERRAQAFYKQVMTRFGRVTPFVNIERAEARHEQMVINLMKLHSVPVNNQPPTGVPTVPDTLVECRAIAAQAERDNIAMYDDFLNRVTHADIRRVFENLRAASLNNHLPAFER